MNVWCSSIMNMQSQGYVEWVISEISTVSWTQRQGWFLVNRNDDWNTYHQNNIELNITQYWHPYCHLCAMVDKSIECITMSRNNFRGFYGNHIEFQVMRHLSAFEMYKWIDHIQRHAIRHQDPLPGLNNTKVMLALHFGYLGWRPYWILDHVTPECIFTCTSE